MDPPASAAPEGCWPLLVPYGTAPPAPAVWGGRHHRQITTPSPTLGAFTGALEALLVSVEHATKQDGS